ncbi:MAG: YdcH family protein [Paenirhodobacter sp.]|uniref:YdcH family protein n=1 Tax=Paenirhodobacter sp. TaxID=1965326 RepID=UPI003D1027EC
MSLGSHITELRKKHEALSVEVERATRSPGSDDLQISELKKQKLRIKEQISRLEAAAI